MKLPCGGLDVELDVGLCAVEPDNHTIGHDGPGYLLLAAKKPDGMRRQAPRVTLRQRVVAIKAPWIDTSDLGSAGGSRAVPLRFGWVSKPENDPDSSGTLGRQRTQREPRERQMLGRSPCRRILPQPDRRYHDPVSLDAAPVRVGEEVDRASLIQYLQGKLEGADESLDIEQFPGGHSNLTYLLRTRNCEYVLRRPPLGPVAPRAHDMAREYQVLRAVHPVFPLAPRALVLCEDPAVIGAVFFIMERRRGIVLRRELPPAAAGDAELGPRLSAAFIDCLADLHSIDTANIPLGKATGFLERQVRGWSERWERAKTEELPEMDQLARWLIEHIPASGPPTLVHNDFKLDNLMLDAGDLSRIVAVLDWEMATTGDPLVDLGCTLCYWSQADDPQIRRETVSAVTASAGWYDRKRLVERYAYRTGRDVSRVGYYEVFGLFKVAVVLQQIYFRFRRGQTQDERFRDLGLRVRGLMDAAIRVVEQSG